MASQPIVVLAIFRPVPGRAAELREALVAAIPAVHAEHGCELYAIHDGPDDVIYMIEKWSSVEDLDRHSDGEAVQALNQSIEGLNADLQVLRMTAIPAGTAEQGLL